MWTSVGWVRNVGIIIANLGAAFIAIPSLAAYSDLAIMLGTFLGGAGLVNAGVVKLTKK